LFFGKKKKENICPRKKVTKCHAPPKKGKTWQLVFDKKLKKFLPDKL
jgi:hypothetical protein